MRLEEVCMKVILRTWTSAYKNDKKSVLEHNFGKDPLDDYCG